MDACLNDSTPCSDCIVSCHMIFTFLLGPISSVSASVKINLGFFRIYLLWYVQQILSKRRHNCFFISFQRHRRQQSFKHFHLCAQPHAPSLDTSWIFFSQLCPRRLNFWSSLFTVMRNINKAINFTAHALQDFTILPNRHNIFTEHRTIADLCTRRERTSTNS